MRTDLLPSILSTLLLARLGVASTAEEDGPLLIRLRAVYILPTNGSDAAVTTRVNQSLT